MQHVARLPAPRSTRGQGRLPAPRESIFAVLAELGRKLSETELATISIATGLVALAAAASGRASWMLLGACYLVWCFASWGIFFGSSAPRSRLTRALEMLIVGSATAVFAVVSFGVFFLALGSHWQL
ncbi:MAG: hypothetical protein ABI035_14900 [Gemmatimonadaceae bacterium]